MQAKHFAILIAAAIFLFVVDLIRRQKMTFRYSLFWLTSCIAVILISIWDGVLRQLAHAVGFKLTSNFVFFLLLAFFTGVTLMLTIYINEQNERTQSLAQTISALQYKIQKLEDKKKAKDE